MTNPVERLMARRQIRAMIESDKITVVIQRRMKISTPGNGWKWGPTVTLDPQEAALMPFKRRMTEFLVNTELGDVPDLPYLLLGYPDLDVRKDDRFTWNGEEFVVGTVDFKKEVRVAAQVDYFGGNSNG